MSTKIFIFDLDGTLADMKHRVRFIENKPDGADWPAFFAACVDDTPIRDTIFIAETLYLAGHDVVIWSGRNDIVRAETIAWLAKHTMFGARHIETILKMRKDHDYRPDDVIKAEWLDSLDSFDRDRVAGAFEDRDRVAAMWRKKGVTCYHVAEGKF